MILLQITALVVVGLALFLAFLSIAIQGPPKKALDSSVVTVMAQMVSLQGVSFAGAKRLLDDSEYQMLASSAQLRGVAKLFRKERKTLALLWISLLLDDVRSLWRFRRFLVRNGVPATFREEIQILGNAVLAVATLHLLRILIYVAGPFALSGGTRGAHRLVESMSQASARILDRLPRTGWPELQKSWQNTAA